MKAWYTVQTLIKRLEKFNPNAEVLIGVEDDNLFDSDVIKGFATGIDKIDYDHDDFMKCTVVQLYSTEVSNFLKERMGLK
tara:strand:- start:134 stop:373 length:240 start_codon:yes stop_codon:yes gene_type:complete